MSLEFKPTIKSINIASEDLTKITLEVKNGSLDGKYDTEDIIFADEQTEELQNEEIAQNNDEPDVLNQETANSSKDSQNATDEILEPNKETEEIEEEESVLFNSKKDVLKRIKDGDEISTVIRPGKKPCKKSRLNQQWMRK